MNRKIREIIRDAATIAKASDRLGATVDQTFRDGLPQADSGETPREAELRRLLDSDAERGIHHLRIDRQQRGSARVRVDHTRSFVLRPAPMRVFDILVEAAVKDRDRWLSRDELTGLLGCSRKVVNTNVERVRKAMRAGGLNDALIQRRRNGDTRLILARDAVVERHAAEEGSR